MAPSPARTNPFNQGLCIDERAPHVSESLGAWRQLRRFPDMCKIPNGSSRFRHCVSTTDSDAGSYAVVGNPAVRMQVDDSRALFPGPRVCYRTADPNPSSGRWLTRLPHPTRTFPTSDRHSLGEMEASPEFDRVGLSTWPSRCLLGEQ